MIDQCETISWLLGTDLDYFKCCYLNPVLVDFADV